MTSNGVNGKSAESSCQLLTWEMGILNGAGKYLTAEPFGFKLNVSATSLKKRQLWTIVPVPNAEYFFVMSHLKRYLSSDKDGKVTCEAEEQGAEEQFLIEYCPSSSGKWALKNVSYGYYLTGSEDNISCFSKSQSWWSVRLAVHPQVHLRNVKRQRYVRLSGDQLQGDQLIPWGYDSLITLEFSPCGRVAVCSRDHRYLTRDGGLADQANEDTLYGLELRADHAVCLRDREGKYLTLIGSTGQVKSKNKSAGKDEMFALEVSWPQVGLRAHNDKYASIKQGVDLYANQAECGETETFQLEYCGSLDNGDAGADEAANDDSTTQWRVLASNSKFWTVADVNNGIKATSAGRDAGSVFEIRQLPNSSQISLRAVANGQFVGARKLGLMSASCDNASGVESLFRPVLLNRPIIIFKSEFGLVGVRSGRLECSMSSHEAFELENMPDEDGSYCLKVCGSGKEALLWTMGPEGQLRMEPAVDATDKARQRFHLRLHSGTHCVIVASCSGRFVRGEQNGLMKADADSISKTSLWEF